mgnify:CR=1 FL=1
MLTVAGLTPQVITETLYALTQQRGEVVHEVHVWTTEPGRQLVRRELLAPGSGKFHTLCEEYALSPRPVFDESTIHVFVDENGAPLEDIRTESDNEAVADQLVDFVRLMTQQREVRLLCSLAGGRKTIGTYLALALQFFGRVYDELFHVLVSPELESRREFFYPPRGVDELFIDGRRVYVGAKAVQLARVPIVLLREHIRVLNRHEGAPARYSELVERVQQEMRDKDQPASLLIDLSDQRVVIHGQCEVSLTPLQFALYLLLARRRAGCSNPDCPGCQRCFVSVNELLDRDFPGRMRELILQLRRRDARHDDLAGWQEPGQRMDRFSETKSRIQEAIRRAAKGALWSERYIIKRRTSRTEPALFGLALNPDQIRILGKDSPKAERWPVELRAATRR